MPSLVIPFLTILGTLSSTASAACTVSNAPTKNGLHCGQTGTLKTPYPISKFTSTSGDSTSCRNNCLYDASCKSFSFDSASNDCAMYSDKLVNQGWQKDKKSTVAYWSRRCFVRTCSPDPTSTTDDPGPTTTDPPDGNPDDPTPTPADPSAFTATYTYDEGLLPTFTDPVPTLTGLSTSTPVPKCMADPSDANSKFEIFDNDGVALIYQSANPPRIGLLRDDQIPHSEEEMKALKYPQFHFEKPAKAPTGFYDLVIEDPDHGNFYLAREGYGNILLVSQSSNGQTPKKIDGQTVVTTIWGVDCDGKVAVGTTDQQYVWQPKGKYTVVQSGDPQAVKPFLMLPMTAKTAKRNTYQKRNAYQDGAFPRCIAKPTPLFADVRKGARAPQSNGCGSGSTAAYVPNLDFGSCCNHHDLCYDDCTGGFKTQCDDSFHDCMRSSCDDDLGSWWEYPALLACYRVADFYYAVVAGLGGDAFVSSTRDRCQCFCNDRKNNQLCSVNGADPTCIFINGNDNNNCGGCGQQCPGYAHCGGGTCKCNQDTCAGGLCLSLQNHPRNCGSCGHVCDSGYCYQGHCYTPPPPSPTSCTPRDAITNGGFDSSDVAPFKASNGPGNVHAYVGSDEGHGPDLYLSSGVWPVVVTQDVVVCPGTRYTFTMLSYSWNSDCTVTVSMGGHQILSQSILYRQHDADLPGSIGPGNLFIDGTDSAFTNWGVSRNATLQMSFTCGGQYTTVYVDNVSFYPN